MWKLLLLLLAASAEGRINCRYSYTRCQYFGHRRAGIYKESHCCKYLGKVNNEHRYTVDGKELSVQFDEGDEFLMLNCNGSNVWESGGMPRPDNWISVKKLAITNCLISTDGTIADRLGLSDMEMIFSTRFTDLSLKLAPSSQLTEEHFDGFDLLTKLEISGREEGRVNADRNFLSKMKYLRELNLQYVNLSERELDVPRQKLQKLILRYTGVKHLPKNIYELYSLDTLIVESDIAFDLAELPLNLRLLDLKSSATTLQVLNSLSSLEKVFITNWIETQPQRFTSCKNLKKLHLTAPAIQTLPDRWLDRCSKLEELVIEKALNLTSLPQELFGFLESAIKRLAFKEGVLETLNQGQFFGKHVQKLIISTLELNGNRLREIPKETLPASVESLNLSANDLDSAVLNIVAEACNKLQVLNLSDNPRIEDVCDENGYSPIRNVITLKQLFLSRTNVTRLCRDWRDMPLLEELDLRHTRVSKLSFEDLQIKGVLSAKVLLEGAPVRLIEMTGQDFEKAKHTSNAFVNLDNTTRFECDCRMYWTRRVLEDSPHILQRITELQCENGKMLNELMAEDMVCARPGECAAAALPESCTCSERPDDNPARDRQLLRVDCTRAALDHVPRMSPSENRLYELLLADNQITNVSVSDLSNVKTLDLRNNYIQRVDEETASRLSNMTGMLRLAGNRLDCDCSALSLLQALHNRALGYTDLGDITCSDGTALVDVPVVECPPSITAYVASLAALFTLAVTVIAYLASRERRFFAKAVLHRWGCFCYAATDEDDRRYDAFISFSHKDEDVVLELMARLEPPYRLCVHHRDWVPGLRIPDQIVESVRESRRTLALVSRHFLASSWTRAEFREAHAAAMLDARPRLVVILLEDPAALALDEQLQRYIATHTYLRWGDPWFYHKLAVALPRPRLHQSVTEPSHLAPSAGRPVPLRALEQNRLTSHKLIENEVSIPLMPVVESC